MTVGVRVKNHHTWMLFKNTLTSFDPKLVDNTETEQRIRAGRILYRKIIARNVDSYRGFRFGIIIEFGEFTPYTDGELGIIEITLQGKSLE